MLATLEGVVHAGFRPVVAAPALGPLADVLHAMGIETVPFETQGPDGTRRSLDVLRADLAERIRSVRPALFHANSLAMGRLSGPVAAESGVPSCSHLRDIVRLSRQAISDLNRHTRLLAVSNAVRQFHVAGGLDAAKTRALYNGVDLDQFCPRAPSGFLHRELGLPAGVPLIGTIGQISLRKGQDVLADALVRVAGRTAAHWLIVGQRFSDKDESRQFEASLRQLADGAAADGVLAGRIHFLGFRADVDRILNELTLLVHPARQEPLGRVLLEAAASGVAVIAADVGGTREIFPQEDSARLVPVNDSQALAEAVNTLLADASLRRRIGEAARKRMTECFDRRQATAGLIEHYRELAGC